MSITRSRARYTSAATSDTRQPAPCRSGSPVSQRVRGAQYFDIIRNMELLTAADLLAALGHEARLSIFRLLVEAGDEGLFPGTLAEQLGLAPATLSFHLAHLSRVGLIRGLKEGRFIRYSTDYRTMDDLIAFLTQNCCQGGICLPQTAAAASVDVRRTRPKACA